MFHSLKRFWLVLGLLLAGGQSIFAFALLGPFNEAYQVPTIGYHLVPPSGALGNEGNFADVGAPKNYRQGYRWNTPTNFYAYDATFLTYFGSNGVTAVDQAFAIYNNLTNVTSLNVDDWPLKSGRVNYRAQALQLLDLKSFTMSVLIEQLGLAQPDRYVWCLHDRFLPGGAMCPAYEYLIIQRNYDPVTELYSPYVNGVLYGYSIVELCPLTANPYAPLEADAIETQVDPTEQANSGSAVAAYGSTFSLGTFFTSLTRDDVGGLKSLYAATNVYVESVETNSLQLLTNQNNIQILVTSNFSIFAAQALTNNGPALNVLYPTLVITSNTIIGFSNVVTTNVTAVLTNFYSDPAGMVRTVLVNVLTTNIQTLYSHTYGNLFIVHTNTQGSTTFETVQDKFDPYAPAGQFVLTTNFSTSFLTSTDYYILPTNLCGPYQILSTQLVQQVSVTNNLPIITTGVTNGNTGIFFANEIISFNQYSLVVYPVECQTNAVALREGMEKINFLRQDYDSLLSRSWTPVTNLYNLTAITNGQAQVQTFRRILTVPDIIISAADLASGPGNAFADPGTLRPNPNFNVSQVPPNQGGPGTIQPSGLNIVYNSVGPIYYNIGPSTQLALGTVSFFETNSVQLFNWGSYDGSTNDPVVYPSSTSIASLEAQIFFQITITNGGLLPPASVTTNTQANPYSASLTATGASPPYVWSLASGSAGLPAGLSISASGLISGVPTTQGIYDFVVQAKDIGARIAQKELFIVVGP